MRIERLKSMDPTVSILQVQPPLGLADEEEFIKELHRLCDKPHLVLCLELLGHLDEDMISIILKGRTTLWNLTGVNLVVTASAHDKLVITGLADTSFWQTFTSLSSALTFRGADQKAG